MNEGGKQKAESGKQPESSKFGAFTPEQPFTHHVSRFTFHASRITHHVSRPPAFTLMEVMIACGIFFMATFAILGLVSNTLRNARGIQRIQVDAGMAAAQAYQIIKTNRQAELSLSGDFGDSFRDYSWEAESTQFDTNGLLLVNIVVTRRGLQKPVDTMTMLVFDPDAKSTFGSPGR
jgi:type II secretory pathway pseudopilin PulG